MADNNNTSDSGMPHHSNSSHSNTHLDMQSRSQDLTLTQMQSRLQNGTAHQYDWDDDEEECEVDDAFLESTGLLSPVETIPMEDRVYERWRKMRRGRRGAWVHPWGTARHRRGGIHSTGTWSEEQIRKQALENCH